MQVFTGTIDPNIINAGSAIVLALLGWGFKLLREFILEKVKNQKFANTFIYAADIVETVVLEMQQSLVDGLKEEGKFTKEVQLDVLLEAKNKIMSLIPKRAIATLDMLYGDVDLWIIEKIEAAVYRNKKEKE